MRDRNSWHRPVSRELARVWGGLPGVPEGVTPAHVCQVELGLRVLERVAPGERAEGAYTLFGGYPFARAAGFATAKDEALLATTRHLLWTYRRGHAWRQALETYRQVPEHVRAYRLPEPSEAGAPQSLLSVVAPDRISCYDDALARLPDFVRRPLSLAPAGRSTFREQRRASSVEIPEDLVFERPVGHDLDALRAGRSEPRTVSKAELLQIARWMDEAERDSGAARPGNWERRMAELTIALRDTDGSAFEDRDELPLDGLLHMVGMVGAGKSTLMTVTAVWGALRPTPLRTTIVVGDAAEQLRLCEVFAGLGVSVVPLLGTSTRETHVQRLHRRLASRGLDNLLDHDDRAFDELSTVCVVSGLRGVESAEPLRFADAPCTTLFPERVVPETEQDPIDLLEVLREPLPVAPAPSRAEEEPHGTPNGCPVWARCPRHNAARAQVDALVWVANPASLVQSPVAAHLNDERLRQLELACLRSDIIFVDEADNVQMRLDQIFAPSATLVQPDLESWLDRLHTHKIEELCRKARLPLTDRQVQQWNTALGGVTMAVDPLCRQLITETDIRDWADIDYFSPWTLQQKLLDEWFGVGTADAEDDETELYAGYDDVEGEAGGVGDAPESVTDPRRTELTALLDAFRDDPFGDRGPYGTLTDSLIDTARDLLHSLLPTHTRDRLRVTVSRLLAYTPEPSSPGDRDEEWWDTTCRRVGFMLLLSALHQRLDRLTILWPQVEAALRLDAQGKELARRAPLDYAPVVPEAPMGNVLGFQYLPDEQEQDLDGRSGGTLRFFRCAGVGRELLLRLQDFGANPAVGRGGPHVILMSGTSWAGESTRAHVLAPVGAVLKPSPKSLAAVAESRFSTHFLYDDGKPMSLSGTRPKDRLAQARAMAAKLAGHVPGLGSPLDQELARVPDNLRKRALLLVGSYREAYAVADTLESEERWRGRVRVLVPDDADLALSLYGTGLATEGEESAVLRRGDLSLFADDTEAEVLVAPLLAVERGHNILNSQGKAAFGTTLFLVRPHPRPDDLALSIFAINDWITRFVRDLPRSDNRRGPATFSKLVAEAASLAEAGQLLRHEGREEWRRLLSRRYVYSFLPAWEKRAFAWDQLVTMWQVIGRLVRGGVPARVVFVDAAFAPRLARALSPGDQAITMPEVDGLLKALGAVLAPYFAGSPTADPADAELARLLYEPFYKALCGLSHH
ncbi:hypothetical protein ACFVXH_18895 [Kitasatospora sp. NPDC058184]|uniref:pPIWI_RE_Z domain-containing protein n=1 Tax=Kitasatospora sp. NPDC058184 TaxID=3346370 RepID=UPI0036D8033C